MPDRYTEDGELLCQWCDEHPVVAQLDEINGPLVCRRCLDRAAGKPEPPTEAEIERSLRRMELLIGKEWLEPREATVEGE